MGAEFKWMGDKFINDWEKKEKTYIHALGHMMVNQMSAMAHKVSGTLRNSMTYALDNGERSDFDTKHGEGKPPESAKVSTPTKQGSEKYRLRCGSALVYAGPQERHNAWATKSYLAIARQGIKLLKKIMRF